MSLLDRMDLSVDDLAAQWFARIRSGAITPVERAAFSAWRAADSAHETAYVRVEHAWSCSAKAAGHESVRAMRAAALNSIEPEKPVYMRYWAAAAAHLPCTRI